MSLYRSIRRFRDGQSDHHAIARGMVAIVLFVMVGKLAGAGKEMAIAYRYGIGPEVDAYVFIFNLVNLPVAIWFGVLSAVLLPLAARIRQESLLELPRFRAELLGFSLVLGFGLALLGWIGLPHLLSASWLGLPEATIDIAVAIAPVLTLVSPLGVIICVFSIWMLSAGRHVNTLLEGVPALTILVVLLVLTPVGVEALVWATIAGYVFHLICLIFPLALRGEVQSPSFLHRSPQWTPFWQGFSVMLVGQMLVSSTAIIDQFFAARLDEGAIATLGYAKRVLALILGLGGMAIGRATLPVFSKAQALGGEQVPRVAIRWAFVMFAVGIVALVASWFLAPWGVKLLFERGAFEANDTAFVVDVFRYGIMQLPFYFAGVVLLSLLLSQRRYRTIALIALANVVVKVTSTLILIPSMGINGIALSDAIMYAGSLVLMGISAASIRR